MVSEDSFFKYIWVLPSVFISRDSDSFQKPRPPLYKVVIPISIIFFFLCLTWIGHSIQGFSARGSCMERVYNGQSNIDCAFFNDFYLD